MIVFNTGSVDFNPRSREGSDLAVPLLQPCRSNFNPRSREGSDRAYMDVTGVDVDFNPRSREGSDVSMLPGGKAHAQFQSTLP